MSICVNVTKSAPVWFEVFFNDTLLFSCSVVLMQQQGFFSCAVNATDCGMYFFLNAVFYVFRPAAFHTDLIVIHISVVFTSQQSVDLICTWLSI